MQRERNNNSNDNKSRRQNNVKLTPSTQQRDKENAYNADSVHDTRKRPPWSSASASSSFSSSSASSSAPSRQASTTAPPKSVDQPRLRSSSNKALSMMLPEAEKDDSDSNRRLATHKQSGIRTANPEVVSVPDNQVPHQMDEEPCHPFCDNDSNRKNDDESDMDVPYAQNLGLSGDTQRMLVSALSETRKEPLRPGDVIAYHNPIFVAGTAQSFRIAQILHIDPDHASFPLELSNGEYLPADTVVRRVREYRHGRLYHHPGIGRPIENFVLVKSSLTVQERQQSLPGMQQQIDYIRNCLSSLQAEMSILPPDDADNDIQDSKRCVEDHNGRDAFDAHRRSSSLSSPGDSKSSSSTLSDESVLKRAHQVPSRNVDLPPKAKELATMSCSEESDDEGSALVKPVRSKNKHAAPTSGGTWMQRSEGQNEPRSSLVLQPVHRRNSSFHLSRHREESSDEETRSWDRRSRSPLGHGSVRSHMGVRQSISRKSSSLSVRSDSSTSSTIRDGVAMSAADATQRQNAFRIPVMACPPNQPRALLLLRMHDGNSASPSSSKPVTDHATSRTANNARDLETKKIDAKEPGISCVQKVSANERHFRWSEAAATKSDTVSEPVVTTGPIARMPTILQTNSTPMQAQRLAKRKKHVLDSDHSDDGALVAAQSTIAAAGTQQQQRNQNKGSSRKGVSVASSSLAIAISTTRNNSDSDKVKRPDGTRTKSILDSDDSDDDVTLPHPPQAVAGQPAFFSTRTRNVDTSSVASLSPRGEIEVRATSPLAGLSISDYQTTRRVSSNVARTTVLKGFEFKTPGSMMQKRDQDSRDSDDETVVQRSRNSVRQQHGAEMALAANTTSSLQRVEPRSLLSRRRSSIDFSTSALFSAPKMTTKPLKSKVDTSKRKKHVLDSDDSEDEILYPRQRVIASSGRTEWTSNVDEASVPSIWFDNDHPAIIAKPRSANQAPGSRKNAKAQDYKKQQQQQQHQSELLGLQLSHCTSRVRPLPGMASSCFRPTELEMDSYHQFGCENSSESDVECNMQRDPNLGTHSSISSTWTSSQGSNSRAFSLSRQRSMFGIAVGTGGRNMFQHGCSPPSAKGGTTSNRIKNSRQRQQTNRSSNGNSQCPVVARPIMQLTLHAERTGSLKSL